MNARFALRPLARILVAGLALAGSAQAAPYYWADWTGVTSGTSTTSAGTTVAGTITTNSSTVTVSYENAQGIAFAQTSGGTDFWTNGVFSSTRNNATSPYTSTVVDNAPTGTDIVALRFAGNQRLVFSESIANPVFAYVSLNGNGYAFLDQDFEILSQGGVDGNDCGYWGCGSAQKVVVDLGNGHFEYQLNAINGEPHGAIRFLGSFSTLQWRSQSAEDWNGFTVGIQGTSVEVFETPEPGTLALVGLAALGLGLGRRSRV